MITLSEERRKVIEEYIQKGYKQKDDEFRKSLELGPQERRWLGWSGMRVRVLRAVEGKEAPLCPTKWTYHFVHLNGQGCHTIESNEINFCDDDNVIDRLSSWQATPENIEFLKKDIQTYIPMYYI
jgi:hypothetical protein